MPDEDVNADQPTLDPSIAPKIFIMVQLLPNGGVNVQTKGITQPLMHMLLGTAADIIRDLLKKQEDQKPKIALAPGVNIPGLRR